MRIQIAKCGHLWFHKGCHVCEGLKKELDKEFKSKYPETFKKYWGDGGV